MSVAASKAWFVVVLVFFAGIAMTSRAQMTKPAPPTPIDEKKGELGGTTWNPQWDEIIEKALPPEMMVEPNSGLESTAIWSPQHRRVRPKAERSPTP